MLFRKGMLLNGEYSQFLIGGLIERAGAYQFRYKFKPDFCERRTYLAARLFGIEDLSYNLLVEKLSKVLVKHGDAFGKCFHDVRAYDAGKTYWLAAREKIVKDTMLPLMLVDAGLNVQLLISSGPNETAVLKVTNGPSHS